MNQLLTGEDRIIVNNSDYPLTPEGNRKLLEQKSLLLQDKNA
jgi:hypothetical protein